MKKLDVFLDYETKSEVDLKKVGAVKYSKHPTTDIICASYKLRGGELKTWYKFDGEPMPSDLKEYLSNYSVYRIIAHNSFFEHCITKNVVGINRPVNSYSCTASRSRAFGLPGDLEGAAIALGLATQKNMDGRRLVLKYCKPRPAYTKWVREGKPERKKGPPEKWYSDYLELMSICEYCETDIEVTEELDSVLPYLNPFEFSVWSINQHMNYRGVRVDLETVKKIIKFNTEETLELQKEASRISNGAFDSVLQRDAVLKFCAMNGFHFENLTAGTVIEALERDDLSKDVRRVLEIRKLVSKTSIKKYEAIKVRASKESRVADLTLYYGAATGRESGRGVQVQNLPRGTIKNTEQAIDDIILSDTNEDLKMFYENTSAVYSSCIRGMFTATPGYKLVAADLNAIECRVLNWLAENESVLSDFRESRDPYVRMASIIFRVALEKIDGAMRFLGKTAELGCGYQMGDKRFLQTCIEWGVPGFEDTKKYRDLAKRAVKAYRDTHQPVVNMWANYESAAIKAIKTGRPQAVGRVTWGCTDSNLWVELPSGRRIYMHGASLRNEETPWGEMRPKIYYHRQDSQTKKWVNRATYGGSLVESVCQGVARDVTMHGIYHLHKNGYKYLFQVHDEAICEKKGNVDIDEFVSLLVKKANWFKDLPVKAEGWVGERYRK